MTKSDKCEINIYGEDIWNKDESIQRKIVWLSIFDFQFGNSMENLPISAHYSKNFDYNEKSEYNLHLTEKDFINVEKIPCLIGISVLLYKQFYAPCF